MTKAWRRHFAGLHLAALVLWALVACAGSAWLASARLAQLHAAFETDARIVHRLLSQRVVQHDAVMSTLALLQPPAAMGGDAAAQAAPLPRLPSVYPQILSVLQRPADGAWPAALQTPLAAAEAASRRSGHPEMALPDLPAGRFYLVLGSTPASHALQIDLRTTVPQDEWPMDMAASPVRVTLEHGGAVFVVQPGRLADGLGWSYEFHKLLAAASQPLDVVARRKVGLAELPWLAMLGWCALTAALWAGAVAWWRQRVARQRAEELLRLGQVARLNTLGELAAGMAHELNQPLTALLSSTQAAQRLLADEPPDLATAQTAMSRAVEQARRATAVVGRLRRLVERPDLAGQAQSLPPAVAVQDVLHLLEPEMAQRGVAPTVAVAPDLPAVLAEPVALQQIVHNLLMNALQALDQVPQPERRLALRLWMPDAAHVALSVRDHGPGVPPEARAHLFEPFYTTRTGGLGLGLTLCESLAQAMGASLVLAPQPSSASERGAEFVLTLPAAPTTANPQPAPVQPPPSMP
ncbi:ATP-binding protein [Acidovorax sp. sic0104]|uniref:sensor histidine kinase n=1 Tax=Acidovorax sp. sic0104 TaxID=2854784 RepID=UPI001C473950|nr:ATP-binding protein [Acidovorax sp. sic0104]MBV7542277.1 two-component sensor histidine kinase [Acidovorax sp. sic0104]